MVVPLAEVERDLLEAIVRDRNDLATRRALARYWLTNGQDRRGELLQRQCDDPRHDGSPAAWLCGPIVRAGYVDRDLTFTNGLLTHPLAVVAGGPLDGDPEVVRCSPLYYRVHHRIEGGTTTQVHLAEAVTPRSTRLVALKVAPPGEYEREVLAREGAILASVEHPNVARSLGPALHLEGPALALEWAGIDLRAVLAAARARHASLGAAFAISVSVQMCAALDALAAAGIVHGSLSPDHVLVSHGGAVTLIAFGSATSAFPRPVDPRPFDPEAPEDPTTASRIRYVAPEQLLAGKHADAGTDVWSTAVIASELVDGQHPISQRSTEPITIAQAIIGPLEPSVQFPQPLRQLVLRALDRDGGRRPQPGPLRAALLEAAASSGLEIGPEVIARRLVELGVPDHDRSAEVRATLHEDLRQQELDTIRSSANLGSSPARDVDGSAPPETTPAGSRPYMGVPLPSRRYRQNRWPAELTPEALLAGTVAEQIVWDGIGPFNAGGVSETGDELWVTLQKQDGGFVLTITQGPTVPPIIAHQGRGLLRRTTLAKLYASATANIVWKR